MTKFLTGVISAAAITAAISLAGLTARADTLPPCSTHVNDHCIQMGGETMKPSPKVKAAQQKNVKAVKKKAGEMGTAVKKKWKEMTGEKPASTTAPSSIPHGCSPVTTPCE